MRPNRSYGLGLWIVAGTVALAAIAAPFAPRRAIRPAAEDVHRQPIPLGQFQLIERSGKPVSNADLASRVWIAAFIYTKCPASCPRISAQMSGLQSRLAGTNVRLVSISVDPEHDTPQVLAAYATRFKADRDRWWFLTGPKHDVYRLILDRFKLAVTVNSAEDRKAGAEDVSHSLRLALVGRGNRVVGIFDSTDPESVDALLAKARQRDMGWVLRLPAINAALNGSCAVMLVAAWTLIRRGRVRGHATLMTACLVVSSLFLSCYLLYHYHVGSVPFRAEGPARAAYLTILLSHTVLAIVALPLIILTVLRAIRSRFVDHASIARVTFPVWLYVSLTGVVVYLMLYQWHVPSSMAD
jgi:protein SCO1/2/putative membrane protein